MKVTTRDLFNFVNPACKYQTFLKQRGLVDGIAQPEEDDYIETRELKQQGILLGDSTFWDRSNDEVDCGD